MSYRVTLLRGRAAIRVDVTSEMPAIRVSRWRAWVVGVLAAAAVQVVVLLTLFTFEVVAGDRWALAAYRVAIMFLIGLVVWPAIFPKELTP